MVKDGLSDSLFRPGELHLSFGKEGGSEPIYSVPYKGVFTSVTAYIYINKLYNNR